MATVEEIEQKIKDLRVRWIQEKEKRPILELQGKTLRLALDAKIQSMGGSYQKQLTP